jgi:hypothetical protein
MMLPVVLVTVLACLCWSATCCCPAGVLLGMSRLLLVRTEDCVFVLELELVDSRLMTSDMVVV